MTLHLHAVAIDYDGTLAEDRQPHERVLAAVQAVRAAGRKVVLVTGRILAELRADFPDVDRHFDAIVAENGAVLYRPGHDERLLGTPVEAGLEVALRRRGVFVRRGQVILATDAVHGEAVYEELTRLGLDDQLVRNRAALMVLPPGVTKGSGVTAALEELLLSPHVTAGIGDAENDHSLLDACEVGVAVANAIPALKARADLVLDRPDGAGVAGFLLGPFLQGIPATRPPRRHVVLGHRSDGSPLTIPTAGVNVEVYGPSGAGKSFVAGLIAEQLITMKYIVCVLDLEGDHVPLAGIRGVMLLGGHSALPGPVDAARLLTEGLSVVVDLSLLTEEQKRSYAMALLDALGAIRASHGLPHWIVVEEAHLAMPATREGWWCHGDDEAGFCLVSYRPEMVCHHLTRRSDVVITMASPTSGHACLRGEGAPQQFVPGVRDVAHVRHWHKYSEGWLPRERRFVFRDPRGLTGATAGNLSEFLAVIQHASDDVLRHHVANQDFSRWLGDLTRDEAFTRAVRIAEQRLHEDAGRGAGEAFKDELRQLVDAIMSPSSQRLVAVP